MNTFRSVLNRLPQRLAFLAGVMVIPLFWCISQSTWALRNDIRNAGGSIGVSPTGPQWIREIFIEEVAAIFDTPRELFLRGEIPEELLPQAAELDTLVWLVLDRSQVTDAHVAHFAGHPNLMGVRLHETDITDATLETLATLPSLTFVVLTHTQVTPEGVEAFRRAKPNVEIEIDAATEVGLHRYLRSQQVQFEDISRRSPARLCDPGTLTVRKSMEKDLVDSARKLIISSLRLQNLTTTAELKRLIEDQPIESVTLERVELTADGAAAIAATPVQYLSMHQVRFHPGAAQKLSTLSVDHFSIEDVIFTDGEARQLAGLKAASLSFGGEITVEPGDGFVSLDVDQLTLTRSTFTHRPLPFSELRVPYASVEGMELDSQAASQLVAMATESLSLYSIKIEEDEASWMKRCAARKLDIDSQHISRREFDAIAALPLDELRLMSVTLDPASTESFKKLSAESFYINELTSDQADALSNSSIKRLTFSSSLDRNQLMRLRKQFSQVEAFTFGAKGITRSDVEAVAALPNLQSLHLTYEDSPELDKSYWEGLSRRRPTLDLIARDARWRQVWPEQAIEQGGYGF